MDNEKDIKQNYLNIIMILLNAYVNWKFEAIDNNGKPTSQFNLWYKMLNHIEPNVLEVVVIDYIKDNIYPPSSPASLIQHYKKMYKELVKVDASSEFDYAREIYKNTRKGNYLVERTCEILEKEGRLVTANAFRSIKGRFHQDADELEINKWGRMDFIEYFNHESELLIDEQVKRGGVVLIENKGKLMIEENE